VRSATPQELEETETVLKLIEMGWGKDEPAFRQFFTSQYLPDGTAEQFRSFNELMRKSASPKNAASLMRSWFSADVRTIAPRVRCPTLVLHRAKASESRLRKDARWRAHTRRALRAARQPQSHSA